MFKIEFEKSSKNFGDIMYKTKIRINFFDTDPGGVLFFGNLFKIIHSAYEQMMESFNLSRHYFNDPDFAIPIIHTEADYYHPMRTGDLVDVAIKVNQLRSSSFELSYEILAPNETIMAEAKTVHLFVKKDGFEKTELLEDLKNHLEKLN